MPAIWVSLREIAEQTGAGKSGVHDFLKAFEKCDELDFPLPPGITNAGIAMKVYGKVPGEGHAPGVDVAGVGAESGVGVFARVIILGVAAQEGGGLASHAPVGDGVVVRDVFDVGRAGEAGWGLVPDSGGVGVRGDCGEGQGDEECREQADEAVDGGWFMVRFSFGLCFARVFRVLFPTVFERFWGRGPAVFFLFCREYGVRPRRGLTPVLFYLLIGLW